MPVLRKKADWHIDRMTSGSWGGIDLVFSFWALLTLGEFCQIGASAVARVGERIGQWVE